MGRGRVDNRDRFRQSLMQPIAAGQAFRWDHRQQTDSKLSRRTGKIGIIIFEALLLISCED
eukprot:703395-Prymnesium_polylepis.1